jgi:vancomycin permeability regulator SanA
VLLGATAVVVVFGPWVALRTRAIGAISPVDSAPQRRVALVLGAGLRPDGQPSDVLAARVDTAVALYRTGRVRTLVMSGDNSVESYDEVSAMKQRAVDGGVADRDVLLDYAGFRTLDSCARVRSVYGQREVLVVSQRFHLSRAVFLCRSFGVRANGVVAPDPRSGRRRTASTVREIPAALAAVTDRVVLRRGPKFSGPAIDIDRPPPNALRNPIP